MSSKEAKKKPRDKRFEEHLEALERIVHDLESGELPLEESLERYQLGVESLRSCHRILREVEHRVEVLVAGAGEAEGEEPPDRGEVRVEAHSGSRIDVQVEAESEIAEEPPEDDAQLF